jgi:hypothetical protein
MDKWEYKNLQLKTVKNISGWNRISDEDLELLADSQVDGWEVFNIVNIFGSMGFTAHILFMLKRRLN